MEGGNTIIEKMDTYNQTMIQLAWNHKIKLVVFTLIIIIAHINIPKLQDMKEKMKYKCEAKNNCLLSDEIEHVNDVFDMIVDVRSKEEYEKGHVINSVNIEYSTILEETGKKILKQKGITNQSKVLLYCKTGKRANLAREHMINNLGYKKNYIYFTTENYKEVQRSL
jgi:rhodanese-related sulfurtransferase